MSVEQIDKVDFISTDKDNVVVLSISDHLDWEDEGGHLLVLQEKLNAYLRFLESGEILESYPSAAGCKCMISVAAKFEPTKKGFEFLNAARSMIEQAGFAFRFQLHRTD